MYKMLFLSGIIQCRMCNRESSIKIEYAVSKPLNFEIEGWKEIDGEHFCSDCFSVLAIKKFFEEFLQEELQLEDEDLEEIVE